MADNGITMLLDGVKGTAGVEQLALNVINWNWGMSNYPQDHANSGLSATTPQVSGINFQKQVCKGSPIIMQYLTKGKHFDKATLQMRKSTGGQTPEVFMTIELTHAFVATYSTGSDGSTDEMIENVSLVFEEMKVDYRPQKTAGGELDAAISFNYNRTSKTTS